MQAKAGVIGLTKTVAKEWGAYNIRCNGLAYGFIATRLTAEKGSGDSMQVAYQLSVLPKLCMASPSMDFAMSVLPVACMLTMQNCTVLSEHLSACCGSAQRLCIALT